MRQATTKTKVLPGIRAMQYVLVLLAALGMPGLVFSQPPPPNGGNLPDTPLGVPFDSNMSLLLLFAGVVFAVIVLKKIRRQRDVKELVN